MLRPINESVGTNTGVICWWTRPLRWKRYAEFNLTSLFKIKNNLLPKSTTSPMSASLCLSSCGCLCGKPKYRADTSRFKHLPGSSC